MIGFWGKRPKTPTKKFQFSRLHIISGRFVYGNNMLFPIAYQNSRSRMSKWYAFGENGQKRRQKIPIQQIAYHFKVACEQKWYAFSDCVLKRLIEKVKIICFWRKRPKSPPKNYQFTGLRIISRRFVYRNNALFPIAYQNGRSKGSKW